MAVLEAASHCQPDQSSSEWEWLMKRLGLGPEYFLAIYEAVRQGRWRKAKNPRAYIKTVARRQGLKMGLLREESKEFVLVSGTETDGGGVTGDEVLDFIGHQRESAEPLRGSDGVWRAGGGRERDIGDSQGEFDSYRQFLLSNVPAGLTIVKRPSKRYQALIEQINASTDEFHYHLGPSAKPNWAKWAKAAGLDAWERKVLDCKLNGVSREHAMKKQPDEDSRKAIQAAWKRFDRNGLQRLLEAAKKLSSENVPE